MQLSIRDHWLTGAERIASPNCNERPDGRIDLLVIHCISLPPNEFGGPYISELFCNRLDRKAHPYFETVADLQVSAHLLVRRDGSLIQYVPFDKRAWHAGVSCFGDEQACNDFSIGIELEGADDTPYEAAQYQQLAEVTRCLMAAYPGITRERITGHSDIAPGRKTDPGSAFDWQRFRRLVSHPDSTRGKL